MSLYWLLLHKAVWLFKIYLKVFSFRFLLFCENFKWIFPIEGLIWFIVPVSMIICNDVMAYMFGFFFGKTPLIQLSPKKTWEGFIGGGVATVIFGLLLSHLLCHYQYFVCPIVYSEQMGRMLMVCEPSYLFTKQQYNIRLVSSTCVCVTQVNINLKKFPFSLVLVGHLLHSHSFGIRYRWACSVQ